VPRTSLRRRRIAWQNNEIAAFCSVVVFLKSFKYIDRFGSDRMGALFTYASIPTRDLPCFAVAML
jgi:hypothetical protein